MTRLLPALLLLPVSAAVSAEQQWIQVTSSNFELFTTAGEKRAREAVLHFEQVRSFFLKATGLNPSSKGRVRIVAFQSDKEYKPYRVNEGTAAYAGGGRDRDEIVTRSIEVENYRLAVHEYIHILLKPWQNLPLWLNEGTADLYSTLRPIGKKVQVGDLLPARLRELHETRWLDIDALCAVDHSSPWYNERNKQGTFYAESWALMHMIFLDNDYRPKSGEFLHLITAGRPQAEAFQTAFGKQMWEISNDLHDYVRRSRFNAVLFSITLEKSAEEPEVRPAAPLESGLVLAGILAQLRKEEEARQAYEKLAGEYPSDPRIPEGLAYLAWGSHKMDEVRKQFAKAVALGSRNPSVYYEYASLLDQSGNGQQTEIQLLRKALDLDPEFRDARIHLAYLLIGQSDYKGALELLKVIRKVEPEDAFPFLYALAYANYRLGNKDEAQRAAMQAGPYARDTGQKASLDQIVEALRRHGPMVTLADPAPEEDETPSPRLRRRSLSSVTGVLEQLDCLEDAGRLRIRADGRVIQFRMDDPNGIEIRGAGAATVTFDCGPQKARTVRIEYEPGVDDKLGTAGVVRVLEFNR
jgi:tetratricopeptide (TPR) repeat protein